MPVMRGASKRLRMLPTTAVATLATVLALLATRPATAINCQAAATRQEKTICADPAAKLADDRMADAFAALRSGMPEADRDALVTDQRHWISARNDSCTYGADGRPLAGPALSACLAKESEQRRLFLSGMPADGPGLPGALRPFFIKGKDGRVISGLRFANPQSAGERLFNSEVDRQLKTVNVADSRDGDGTDDFAMTLQYATPALVSAEVVISYPSSAHPVDHHADINVDLASGKMLAFEAVFRRDALDAIMTKCRPQLDDFIGKAAKADLDDNDMRESIMKDREKLVRTSIADMSRWSLGSRELILTIDDEAASRITSICRLDMEQMRPIMQPGFRLAQ
jgi:uncharacterized protein YecT (DUF1311 family)